MLEIRNGYKEFNNRTLFKNLNIRFPQKGIFMILGQSGCGKSTLLNIILGSEKLSGGEIYFNHKKLSSEEDFLLFRRDYVSVIFQDYGLIENQTIFHNVSLPLLNVKNDHKEELVNEALKEVDIHKNKYQKCNLLSGGEKQRIALGRLIVNHKKIILCDEPTGSLDEENSLKVFEILKKLAKDNLVIIVSHNEELAKIYADYVLSFDDLKDFDGGKYHLEKIKKSYQHISLKDAFSLSLNCLLYRKMRSFLSMISLIFVNIFLLLSLSLSFSISSTVKENYTHYLNFNCLEVSKSTSTALGNSSFNLIKSIRPEKEELISHLEGVHYKLSYNLQGIFNSAIFKADKDIINISYLPIDFLFNGKYAYLSSLISNMKINQVIINQAASRLINNRNLSINLSAEISTYDEHYNHASDIFKLVQNLEILEIVDEFSFMEVPTVYYYYESFSRYLDRIEIPNASKLYQKPMSYYERLSIYSFDSEDLSSHSYLLFLDEKEVFTVADILKEKGYTLTSYSLTNAESLDKILSSISLILYIFNILSLIIVFFLISSVIYSFVIDRKRELALYLIFGMKKREVVDLFIFDGCLISLFSGTISLILIRYVLLLVNNLIEKYLSIPHLLSLPTFNIPFFFEFIFLLFSLILGLICSLPLIFIFKEKISYLMRAE